MLGRFMYFLLFYAVCVVFILTGYNTFLLLYAWKILPVFFITHAGILLLSGRAVYYFSERAPFVKIVLCGMISILLIFLNSLVSSFPADECDLKSQLYGKVVKQAAAGVAAFNEKNKRLPENMEELLIFDPALKECEDPFAYPQRIISYVKGPNDRFLLYSLGPDNKDDGGRVRYDRNFNMRSYLFPWDSLFFGEWMRNRTELKDKNLGDLVSEFDLDPGLKASKEGRIIKFR